MRALLIEFVIALMGAMGTWALGALSWWLRAKTNNEDLAKYISIAKMVVAAVEQQFSGLPGNQKKTKAKMFLYSKLGGVLSTEEIDHLIESAVFQLGNIYKGTGIDPVSLQKSKDIETR